MRVALAESLHQVPWELVDLIVSYATVYLQWDHVYHMHCTGPIVAAENPDRLLGLTGRPDLHVHPTDGSAHSFWTFDSASVTFGNVQLTRDGTRLVILGQRVLQVHIKEMQSSVWLQWTDVNALPGPYRLALTSKNDVVITNEFYVNVYTLDGTLQHRWFHGVPQTMKLCHLWVTETDRVFVTNGRTLHVFGLDGVRVGLWNPPADVTLGPMVTLGSEVLIADAKRHRAYLVDPEADVTQMGQRHRTCRLRLKGSFDIYLTCNAHGQLVAGRPGRRLAAYHT